MDSPTGASPDPPEQRLRLHGWLHPSVLGAAGLAASAGFAQFAVAAALADVASAFGEPQPQIGVTEQAGLEGTTLGVGLAIIRLASLGALPLAGLADDAGRRKTILVCAAVGLALTAAASLSPTYWWFVAIFALGRPLLSATDAIALVIAGEETKASERSKAIALIGAAYGVGAGTIAVIHGVAGGALGFRGLFALALVPLVTIPLLARWLEEPHRFGDLGRRRQRRIVAAIPHAFKKRLRLMFLLTAAIALIAGPANTFLFYFGESVQRLSPGTMALVVVAAGPTGLLGLLVGRWAADRLGRRISAGTMLAGVALAGVLTYNGGPRGVIVGYLLGILAGSAYAPSAGALATELFPTSVRSTASGWLVVASVIGAVLGIFLVGVLTDALGGFGPAVAVVFLPILLVAALYALLPETRGLELEDSAPEPS